MIVFEATTYDQHLLRTDCNYEKL